MISVACCHVETGKVVVYVPLKFRSLVGRYAKFNEGSLYQLGIDGWSSETPYTLWIQLPGVVVEKR